MISSAGLLTFSYSPHSLSERTGTQPDTYRHLELVGYAGSDSAMKKFPEVMLQPKTGGANIFIVVDGWMGAPAKAVAFDRYSEYYEQTKVRDGLRTASTES